MPLPIIFIGIAAATGAGGIGTTIKAGMNQSQAKKISSDAASRVEHAAEKMEILRKQCGNALQNLGEEKLFVLNNNIKDFLYYFRQIKNVDFRDSLGLEELNKLHIDQHDFEELDSMSSFAAAVTAGSAAGAAGGALTAMGAYGAAQTFATASTGTAISTLSGAAASNATLAFFGGGSLASGGLGIAGGTMVLGGLVAGPALLVMGLISNAKTGKNLENAKASAAQADEACAQLEAGMDQCIAIRRRTNVFYSLLARLDSRFLPQIETMKEIIASEGNDYSKYTELSKNTIAAVATTAVTLKKVLDTPILSDDGNVSIESENTQAELQVIIN